jgi:hypothetical protein
MLEMIMMSNKQLFGGSPKHRVRVGAAKMNFSGNEKWQ